MHHSMLHHEQATMGPNESELFTKTLCALIVKGSLFNCFSEGQFQEQTRHTRAVLDQ